MSQEIINKLDALLSKQIEHAEKTHTQMSGIDKKLDLHIQKTEYELEAINRLDHEQNEQLRLHIEGVQTLKSLYDNHREESQARLSSLENPRIAFALIKKWILGLGALAAAGLAILKFFEYI